MVKKIIFIFIALSLVLTHIAVAETNSTISEPPVWDKLTETFYGEAKYADGNPVPIGSNITIKDQYGKIIGNYTVIEPGLYGSRRPYGDKMTATVWVNMSDRSTRGNVIFISFYVDGIRSRDTVEFKSGENLEFNILLPISKPTPAPTVMPTINPIATNTTPVIISVAPAITTTISVTTTTPLPIITPESTSLIPGVLDQDLVIYGIIGTILVIIGMLIIVIIQSYLMSKSSQDESLGPDGKYDH